MVPDCGGSTEVGIQRIIALIANVYEGFVCFVPGTALT